MRLSKRTEYGLRAIAYLARSWPKGFVQSRDLSQQEGLPNKFLESILLTLRRGGFLESKVGSGGGYRLSREAAEHFGGGFDSAAGWAVGCEGSAAGGGCDAGGHGGAPGQ